MMQGPELQGVLIGNLGSGWSSSSFQQEATKQDVARAERMLFEATESDANQSMAYAILGMLRRMQVRLAESRIALDKAITLDPNSELGNRQLAWTLLFLAEPDAAIARGEKCLRLSPRDSYIFGTYQLIGWSHLGSNRLDAAIEWFIKGCTTHPRIWTFYYGLAGALALKGDLDGAKAALAESLKLRPEVNSLAQWYEYLPCTSKANNPQYWALEDKTLTEGLRRIGFPEN